MAQSIETAGGAETSGTGALAGPTAVEARPAATRSRPLEHHHRDLGGGGARAAVFGISDGLLTNVSLILGVAGANPAPGVVRLAGLAGLVAGAFSMAAGEYISVTAQSELYRRGLVGYSAERPMLPAALRQLGIAILAASVTYGIGALVGVRTA